LALQGWQSLWVAGLLGCLLFAAWGARIPQESERQEAGARAAEPAKGRRRSLRVLVLTAALFCLWSGQFFAFMTWLPEYLVVEHGLGLGAALAGYSLPVGLLILFNLLTGVMLRAGVSLALLLIGSLALQVGVWWASGLGLAGWSGVAGLVVFGVGAGITPACLFAMPSRAVGQGRAAAAAFGIIMTGRNVGVLIGPVLLAQILQLGGAWDLAAPVFGTVTALALAIGVVLAFEFAAERRIG
jgi:hypothetical protein